MNTHCSVVLGVDPCARYQELILRFLFVHRWEDTQSVANELLVPLRRYNHSLYI